MALICPKCEQRAGGAGRSLIGIGVNIRATGDLHTKILNGHERPAAHLVCDDCGFTWSTIHPDALAMAADVRSGKVTHVEHEQPEEVDFG